ncbi:hypothetical protein BJ912DRAFT_1060156 [Pholiota molesta]|nr:hypothetical protein BJ912DRAFT_1060156 [Pholiota molesta]
MSTLLFNSPSPTSTVNVSPGIPAFSETEGSGSEDESTPITMMLDGMTGNPDAQRYFRAMVDAQQEVGRLNAENKALKTELYELKLSSAKTTRGQKAKRLSPSDVPGPADSASVTSARLC